MAQTRTNPRRQSTGTSRSNGSSSPRRATTSAPKRNARTTSAPKRNARTTSARSGRSTRRTSGSTRSRRTRPRSGSSATRQPTNGVAGTLSGVGDSVGSAVGKAGESVGTVAQKAKTPALIGTAAAAGLAGGIALGSKMLSRPKGPRMPVGRPRMSIPGGGGALKSVVNEAREVGKEMGRAGFRLGVGDVSMEVQKGRKDDRDSPLEVLLHGLTNRRSKRR